MTGQADNRGLTTSEVLDLVRRLGEGFNDDATVQDLARHFVRALGPALQGARLAVRLCSLATGEVIAAATTGEQTVEGRLDDPPREDAAEGPYRPVFSAPGQGFVVPLRAGGGIVGAVNVESDAAGPAADQQLVAAMGTILAGAVGNRRGARARDRAVRRHLTRIIDHAPALIFVVDARGTLTLFNRELAGRTGYAASELVGRSAESWLPRSEREAFVAAFARALASGPVTGHELELRGKGGETLRTVFTMARIVDPGDADGSVVAIGQDVTAIKQLEHQIIQAEKLASLGQLAAGVVHEINNPLTSVSVYADYLVKKFKEAGCDLADINMLERILEGSNRILKFTRDLVDYAKPSVDQFDVVSLNEIVNQSVSFCEHILEQTDATLHRELQEDLVPLYGVRDQLQQVVINLITNACHALEGGGGEVRVRTRQVAQDVTFEVSDSGMGIAAEDLHRIFEPFFSTKAPGEGTGLGLSIVKKIVDFHDGSIMVRSEPEGGTTFSITLPSGHRSPEQMEHAEE